MTIEDELRDAMHAEVDGVQPDAGAWTAVRTRGRRRRVTRAVGGSLLAAAGVVAAIVGVGALVRDDGIDRVEVVPPATSATSVDDGGPPGTDEPSAPAQDDSFTGIWPFASMTEVDAYAVEPGIGMFFDAETTALEFARVYLGMPEPTIVEPRGSGEGDTRFVNITSKPGGPFVTTIWVHPFGDDRAYSVIDVYTDNIQLTEPQSLQLVGSEFAVEGTSTAFEATVNFEVRQDGQVAGEHLGEGFVMGGSMGEMGPFADTIRIDPPTTAAGALILYTASADDGGVQEARVIRVRFGDPQPSADRTAFSVFFHRDEGLVEVRRETDPTTGVLRAALDALFAGPTPEEAADGISSLFSSATAELLAGVNVRDDGTAIVDLAGTVNNGSTSAGSAALLAELDATVFQFSTVERVEYRLDGSCEAFWEWLQRGGCEVVERSS